jgi:hypothetical protein
VTRLLLPLALAVSLVIPVGGLAMVTAGMAGGASTTSEWEKDELIDDYNQLTRVDEQARPGSAGQIAEARRIAEEALVWAKENEAEPEWEEFAYATSAMATLVADRIAGVPSFSETRYDHAVDRINAALATLPPERHPY